MTDLEFLTEWGHVLPVSPGGLEVVLDGEFVPWRVRWSGADRGAPFVRDGDGVLELELAGDAYVVPARKRKKGKRDPRNVKFAGLVELYADQACESPLRPWLRVQPANMSQAAFFALLRDLRSLALELSVYLAAVTTRSEVAPPDGDRASLLTSWVAACRAAEDCLDAYERQLPVVDKRPARTLRTRTRLTDSERAVRLGHAQHVFRWPDGQRRVPVPMREYDIDTPEYRFLVATLNEVCRDGETLGALLGARIDDLERSAAEVEGAVRYFGGNPRRGGSIASVRNVDEARGLAESLRQKAQRMRTNLPDRTPEPRGTMIRTNRLIMSPDYRPLLDAWETYRQMVAISSRHADIANRIDERSIAPSNKLYERWATWRIYAGLVAVGFRPPPGEPALLDVVEFEDGAIEYLNGDRTSLRLSKQCHGRTADLVLRHEPAVEIDGIERHPDLVIDARAGHRREVWVFDHKYKDYDLPAPSYDRELENLFGSHFLADLVGVAEHRYRRGMGASVGAIIHPDLDPAFAFWDAVRGDRHEELRASTPHAHLSVPLVPGARGNDNLTKLLRLLLGFRLQLSDTCWRCGTDCLRSDVPNSNGDGYSCDRCGAFWIVHWCRNGHKPILKFGTASFHAVEPGDPYNVHCPWCGDYFKGVRPQLAPVRPQPFGYADPF